jgi:ribosomal protein S18 acetylase RimI-like enzyme
MLKPVLKRAIQLIAEDYWNGWIYVCEPEGMELPASGGLRFSPIDDVSRILQSPDPALRRQAWKREADAWAFGASVGDELAAVCWFQARETYRRHGGLFKLGANEAELVQITTAEAFRGRGVAAKLIEYAAAEMRKQDFRKLYAKIWHDNVASLRAFERAGWKRNARFFSFRLRRLKAPVVLRFRPRPAV